MQISRDDILVSSLLKAEIIAQMAVNDGNPLSIEKIKSLKFPNILHTKYAKNVITAIVMGAIEEYHEQLREKLLESNIDIGEMDFKSTVLRDAYAAEKFSDEE